MDVTSTQTWIVRGGGQAAVVFADLHGHGYGQFVVKAGSWPEHGQFKRFGLKFARTEIELSFQCCKMADLFVMYHLKIKSMN